MAGVVKKEKRSPITTKPLRDPGESLRRRLDDLLMDKVIQWCGTAVLLICWAAMEWIYHFTKLARSPAAITVAAVAFSIVAYFKIRKARFELHDLNQGLVGERIVGQSLECLRANGYLVFHDIEQDTYNIDHVLVGPAGVFAIETKTISKSVGGGAQIVYDGERVLVDGHTPDRDPLKQAEANADRIREIIQERTGTKLPVRPVVLYPGWYIQRKCRNPRVWVLNENYLPGWLDHEPESFSEADIKRYGSVIADYVRGR